MAVSRRTTVLGIVLVVVLVVATGVWMSGGTRPGSPPGTPSSTDRGQGRSSPGTDERPPDVQLEALNVQRAEPGDAERNPFRFQARAPAVPPAGSVLLKPTNQTVQVPTMPMVPAGPPPPPPIPLKFIGVMEQGGKRIAVLSDGRSVPSGTEGTIILGQYRILKIGTDSIEMSYVDGRGRQTIRLTGGQ